MERYIVKNIDRVDRAVCDEIEPIGVATVYEAQGKTGLMDQRMRARQQGARVSGTAVTVLCPAGDNLMIHAAVEFCQPGDILVVSTIGEANMHGMIGELLVHSLMGRGVKGLVIDSGVRDTMEIRELGFPVWSTSVISTGTTKNKAGWVNIPVSCAGTLVNPGDLILADDDGVVVVRREDAPRSLEQAKARVKKEEGTMHKIENGELGVDFYGFREVLDKLGVSYLETAP